MASQSGAPGVLTIEQIDAIRRRVLNVVGHELRTPVTALTGLVAQLRTAEPDDVRDRLAPAIERLAHRTETLLDDLLLASGISTALPTEDPVPVALVAAIEEAWHRRPEASRVETFRCERNGDDVVLISPPALDRLVDHLVRNAASYGAHRVEVTVGAEPDRVRCEIRNDGPVPRPDELALAFEPFFRGEHAVTTGPGLGLGLPIARMLAEQGGGTVDLVTDGSDGVMAVLELPRP